LNKYQILIFTSFFTLLFSGCGTGPWFIDKSELKVYKEPVYLSNNANKIKTNGYYVQTGNLPPNHSFRDILIFYKDGYVQKFKISDQDFENNLKVKLYSEETNNLTEFDWYKVVKDSLLIECFGNPSYQMMTFAYYRTGKINSDGTLELKYDDSNYVCLFEFIINENIFNFQNKAFYLKKKWYQEQLHSSRR